MGSRKLKKCNRIVKLSFFSRGICENAINSLAMSGYKVWMEYPDTKQEHNQLNNGLVCFEVCVDKSFTNYVVELEMCFNEDDIILALAKAGYRVWREHRDGIDVVFFELKNRGEAVDIGD